MEIAAWGAWCGSSFDRNLAKDSAGLAERRPSTERVQDKSGKVRPVRSKAFSSTPRTLCWVAKSCVFSQVDNFTEQTTPCASLWGARPEAGRQGGRVARPRFVAGLDRLPRSRLFAS